MSSVPAKQIVDECRARGYLAKQLYVISTRPVMGIDAVMANLAVHLEFQEKLEREGVMFAAGSNWTDDEASWEGDGTVVVRASSLQEATEIAKGDPMHLNGARSFTVRPWLVNEGSLSVRLDFATGRFSLA